MDLNYIRNMELNMELAEFLEMLETDALAANNQGEDRLALVIKNYAIDLREIMERYEMEVE